MTELAETRGDASPKIAVPSGPKSKLSAPERKAQIRREIDQLIRERQQLRQECHGLENVKELQRQLSERGREVEQQRKTLAARDRELTELRNQRDKQAMPQAATPERIAQAREEGRKLFADFDAVITGAPVDRQAFEAMLASANGPELIYAVGLGMKMIGVLRQLGGQAQADRERVDYYRKLHQEHFAGVNNGS